MQDVRITQAVERYRTAMEYLKDWSKFPRKGPINVSLNAKIHEVNQAFSLIETLDPLHSKYPGYREIKNGLEKVSKYGTRRGYGEANPLDVVIAKSEAFLSAVEKGQPAEVGVEFPRLGSLTSRIKGILPISVSLRTGRTNRGYTGRDYSNTYQTTSRQEEPERVIPRQKSDYPISFKNLLTSINPAFEELGRTYQSSKLKNAFMMVSNPLREYLGQDKQPGSFKKVPETIETLEKGINESFRKFQSTENVDEGLKKMLQDFVSEVESFTKQEKSDWDQLIEQTSV